jgi:putative addiction module killer protein
MTNPSFDKSPAVFYIGQSYEVRVTETFSDWLNDLRDQQAVGRMVGQFRKIGDGNFGNAKSVGDGVHELRMKFGPGYRVYFINRNNRLILLLCGGNKSSQSRDIAMAKSMAKDDLDGTENESV